MTHHLDKALKGAVKIATKVTRMPVSPVKKVSPYDKAIKSRMK